METVNTHVAAATTGKTEGNFITKMFNRQAEAFEKSRFAMMAMLMIIQSCIGSIACMYVLHDTGYWMLAACVFATMGTNALFIAQAEARLCVGMTYVSIFVNTLLIIAMNI